MLTDPISPYLRFLRYLHALLSTGLLIFLIFLLANIYVFTSFRISGHSMDATLTNGQLVGISLVSYVLFPPALHDMVVVEYQGDASLRFAKRIEGVPGDSVLVGGREIILGPNQYYVLGDNRDHSTDSRVFGPITVSQIIGKIVLY